MNLLANVMANSTMVWFEPTAAFWKFFSKHPWKYKHYHDCGAGTGHLTRLMREHGYLVNAYELLPRDKPEVNDIQVIDTTSDLQFVPEGCSCSIIARPCHGTDWVGKTLNNALIDGDAFYIGLKKNLEHDLDGFIYEVVAKKVGKDGELLIRVFCNELNAKIYRQVLVHGNRKEWWWYSRARDRYTSEPEGFAGFDGSDGHVKKVLKEILLGNDLQVYETKAKACDDSLDAGWLAPDGEWFGCHERAHDWVAQHVIGCSVGQLETGGWIRAYGIFGAGGSKVWSFGHSGFGQGFKPTPAQVKVLRRKGYKIHKGDLISDKTGRL